MSKPMQVYYSAMLGALGGLLGWWSVGAVPTGAWNVWLAYPLVGPNCGRLARLERAGAIRGYRVGADT